MDVVDENLFLCFLGDFCILENKVDVTNGNPNDTIVENENDVTNGIKMMLSLKTKLM